MEKVIKVWLKYYPVYLSGLWGTLWISAVTVFLGALLGMVVALMRMSRLKILRTTFNVYVEILRGTPILLQLYFFWIGLPKLVPFELTDTQCIVAALVVNASAFISEIIRAGIGAVLYCCSYPQATPTMGSMLGLKAFVAAVLGGIGSIPGAMIGGIAIGLCECFVSAIGLSAWKDAVTFAILIIVLLVKPTGFLGRKVQEKV